MKQTDKNFFDAIPKVGTEDFNNLAKEMFSGKPKPQTAVKDLAYYKANAEEDYLQVPISVLRYISQLEQGYSLDDLKEAYGMGRTNATIKDFNETFKKK